MAISNIKAPVMKVITAKVVNFKAPKVKVGVLSPRTGISIKPGRAASVKMKKSV